MTAAKTLTMYLRAAKTEAEEAGISTDDMASSVSELREELMSLTGIDIMADSENFKSTFQIMKEISGVWGGLSDVSQANVLNLLGGKRGANSISALITNFQTAIDAAESSVDSAGSAFVENEKYLDSIAGKTATLKAAFEELSNAVVDSNIIKFGTDVLTGITQIATALAKIGALLPAIALAANSIWAFKQGNAVKNVSNQFNTMVQGGQSLNSVMNTLSGQTIKFNTYQKNMLSYMLQNSTAFNALTAAERQELMVKLGLNTATQTQTVSTAGLSGVMATASVAAKGFAVSLRAVWASMSLLQKSSIILSAISLVVSGVSAIVNAVKNSKEEIINAASEISDAYSDAQDTYNSNMTTLTGLEDEFRSLSKGIGKNGENIGLTGDEYERYWEIVNQVVAISPNLISGYDSQGRAIVDYTNLLSLACDQQERYLENSRNQFIGSGEDYFEGKAEQYRKVVKEMRDTAGDDIFDVLDPSYAAKHFKTDAATEKFEAMADALNAVGDSSVKASTFTGNAATASDAFARNAILIYRHSEKFMQSLKESGAYTDDELTKVDTLVKGLAGYNSQLESIRQEQVDYLMTYLQYSDDSTIQNWFMQIPIAARDAFKQGLESIIDPYASVYDNIAGMSEYGEAFANAISSEEGQELTAMAKGVAEGTVSINEYDSAVNKYINTLAGVPGVANAVGEYFFGMSNSVAQATDTVIESVKEIKSLSEVAESFTDGYSLLKDAIEEMNEGEGLSSDTIKSLQDYLGEDEDVTEYLYTENGLILLNIEMWKQRSNAMLQEDADALKNNIELLKEENEELRDQRKLAFKDGEDTEGIDNQIAANEELIAQYQKRLEMNEAVGAQASKYEVEDTDPLGLSDLNEKLNKTKSNAQGLISAIEQLHETDATPLTMDEIAELASEFPELYKTGIFDADTIEEQVAILGSALDSYESEYDALITDQIQTLQNIKAEAIASGESPEDEYVAGIDAAIKSLKALRDLNIEGSFDTEELNLNGLSESVKELSEGYDILSDARADISNGDSISEDTLSAMQSYLGDEENVVDYLVLENGQLKINEELWKNRSKQMAETDLSALNEEIESLDEQIIALQGGRDTAFAENGSEWWWTPVFFDKQIDALKNQRDALVTERDIYEQMLGGINVESAGKGLSDIGDGFKDIENAADMISELDFEDDFLGSMQQIIDFVGSHDGASISDFIDEEGGLRSKAEIAEKIFSVLLAEMEQIDGYQPEWGEKAREQFDELVEGSEDAEDSLDKFKDALSAADDVSSFLTDINDEDSSLTDQIEAAIDLAETFADESGTPADWTSWIESISEDGSVIEWNTEAIRAMSDAQIDAAISGTDLAEKYPALVQQIKDSAAAAAESTSEFEKLENAASKVSGAIDIGKNYGGYTEIGYDEYASLLETDTRYAAAIEYQNGVMTLNSSKHAEITASIMQETKEMALAQKQGILMSDTYQELSKALEAGTIDADGASRLQDLTSQILGYEVLAQEIDSANDAYHRWLNRAADNGMDRYSQAIEAFELIDETLNDKDSGNYGRIGTESFTTGVDFVLGEDVKVNTPEFDEAMERVEKYLTEGAKGATKFYDDLVSHGLIDETTGHMETSIGEISRELGISEQMARAMIDRLNEYNDEDHQIKVTDPTDNQEAQDSLASVIQTLDEAYAAAEQLNSTPLNLQVDETSTGEITTLSETLDTIKQATTQIMANPLSFGKGIFNDAVEAITDAIAKIREACSDSGELELTLDADSSTASLVRMSTAATTVSEALNVINSVCKNILRTLDEISSSSVNIKTGSTESRLGSVSTALARILSRLQSIRRNSSINVRITETTIRRTVSGGSSKAGGGIASASGTAMAAGGKTLVGELGMETVVDPNTNTWYTVGNNGAEFVTLPENAIVFNHRQTRELLGTGSISSRGDAMVGGNAAATLIGNLISKLTGKSSSKTTTTTTTKTTTTKKTTTSNGGDAGAYWSSIDKSDKADGNTTRPNSGNRSSGKKSGSGGGSSSSSTSASGLEALKEQYEETDKQLEHLIAHQEFLYEQAERGYDFTGMQNSLDEQVRIYKQKMQNALDAVEAMKAAGADDTSEELQDMEELYWEATNNMYEALEKINELYIDALNDKIDGVQKAYNTLADAADEFNNDGGISVDTFQSLTENGGKYLSCLEYINGQFVINKDAIKDMVAAEKEQLAVESALSYLQQISQHLTDGNTNALAEIVNLTGKVTDNTWNAVYAQAALLKSAGLTDEQFKQVVQNLDALRAIANGVSADLDSASNSSSSAYDDQKDALEEILDLTEDLIKYETEEKIDAIEDEIDAYQKIIDLKKESLETTKDENDYEKDLADKVKEVAKLQSQIDQLSLDDSREARAERASLLEELADLQDELAEYQGDHAYDTQTDALDKMADDYEESRQDEIDALENSISSEEKLYQLAIERISSSWDTLYEDIIAWNTEAGSSLNSEITESWLKAADAVKQYGDYIKALNALKEATGESSSSSSDERISSDVVANGDLTDTDALIEQYAPKQEEVVEEPEPATVKVKKVKIKSGKFYIFPQDGGKGKALGKEYAGATFEYLGESSNWYNISYKGQSAWISKRKKELIEEEIPKYHTGGLVGGSSATNEEVLALLQSGETVLTNEQTSGLYKIVDFQQALAERLGHAIGSISMMASNFTPAFAGAGADLSRVSSTENFVFSPNINVDITSNGAEDNSTVKSFGEKIANTTLDLLYDTFARRGISISTGGKLKQ